MWKVKKKPKSERLLTTKTYFLLMLHVHLGSVGNKPRHGHAAPECGCTTSTKAPQITKSTESLCFHSQVVQVASIPIFWAKVSGMATSIKRAEKAISPFAQNKNTQNTIC